MTDTDIHLLMLSTGFWGDTENEQHPIASFVREALSIERRILKDVNIASERNRYRLCCSRICAAARKSGATIADTYLGAEYFDVLRIMYEKSEQRFVSGRVGACFFPPGRTDSLVDTFRFMAKKLAFESLDCVRSRLEFFAKAAQQGAGIVEIPEFARKSGIADAKETGTFDFTESHAPGTTRPGEDDDFLDTLTAEEEAGLLRTTIKQIAGAFETGQQVNFSNLPHSITTEALNRFVYKRKPDEHEQRIRIVYMDGSEAAPFPLRCLSASAARVERKENSDFQVLNVSLVSMRHLAMDEMVDFAWFRNRKVSGIRSFAEADAYCTEKTLQMLRQVNLKNLKIHLYQTGLETAIIGFYRGLVFFLKEQKHQKTTDICVTPYYFAGDGRPYREGTPWK